MRLGPARSVTIALASPDGVQSKSVSTLIHRELRRIYLAKHAQLHPAPAVDGATVTDRGRAVEAASCRFTRPRSKRIDPADMTRQDAASTSAFVSAFNLATRQGVPECLHAVVGDSRVTEHQPFQLAQRLEMHQPGIGDLGAVERKPVEPPQTLKMHQPGVRNPGGSEV